MDDDNVANERIQPDGPGRPAHTADIVTCALDILRRQAARRKTPAPMTRFVFKGRRQRRIDSTIVFGDIQPLWFARDNYWNSELSRIWASAMKIGNFCSSGIIGCAESNPRALVWYRLIRARPPSIGTRRPS